MPTPSPSDQRLFEGIRFGNEADFECFFRRYYPRLVNYAARFVAGHETARDLVQDSFARLWERRCELRELDLASLLFTMVRNACLNYLKHNGVVARHELEYTAACGVRSGFTATIFERRRAALPLRGVAARGAEGCRRAARPLPRGFPDEPLRRAEKPRNRRAAGHLRDGRRETPGPCRRPAGRAFAAKLFVRTFGGRAFVPAGELPVKSDRRSLTRQRRFLSPLLSFFSFCDFF